MSRTPVSRLLPTEEAAELLELTRAIADGALAPRAAEDEAAGRFPRDVFRTLGRAGLLGLPFPEEWGGAGLPYEVYVQVLEEISARWASVGIGVSVHALSCFALANHGTDEQRGQWLPEMLGGELLGAYCLSESHAGSDPAAMRTRADREENDGDESGDYVLRGEKAWTTHGGHADFYTVMARTGQHRSQGISCFLVPADAPNLSADPPERKMGLTAQATATMRFDGVRVSAGRRIGAEGQGLSLALAGLDAGRLGIAAVAVGLAQGALDDAVAYAKEREAFGRPIIDHQGLAFLLADMEAAVESARATLLSAARRKDAGLPYGRQASIAKLVATEAAMRVTTDAVQVFGGAGYTRDFPVERYMREAKVMQIFEGTNQIQRMVISRELARGRRGPVAHVLSLASPDFPDSLEGNRS
ncbi:acyl-CoA dehydrogenase family protein [Streptomyces viridochromogenes]|uniref:acyl-CoA dehydrogenase family protein n=1 Tax=Streptomyces viridochromogenes TaxID=1938 RepID=UPI00069FF031|nr:acyl-CoA dehydrogenase family protein [Streptomyces viridochromogenes]KOG23313.1 acyl-CoA dehydrogenase [Streptomyces viridochromogenes]KOG27081.1 acyl-CoA dehydrogenase [Streptomyces viridochromogenes]